jgi:long-chain acyl-CoA synthetase
MVTEAGATTPPWLAAYPAGIDWAAAPAPATLNGLFAASAARYGARPCLDFMGRRQSFADVAALVARAAEGFRRAGVGPGTRVGLCLPNCPAYLVAFYGALRAGATVVNFSPLYVAEEMAWQAADAGVSLMVAPNLDPILSRVLSLLGAGPVERVVAVDFAAALPFPKSVLFRLLRRRVIAHLPAGDARVMRWQDLLAAPPIEAADAARPEDLAVLQYTGGTTGRPKGAMLTHGNLAANAQQVVAWSPQARPGEERTLAVLPFFHVFALTSVLNASIVAGHELIVLPRFEAKAVLAALRRRRPTIAYGVPTLFRALLDAGATTADLASVRICVSGGAPLPLELRHAFEAKAGCALVEGYGLTEAAPVCFCNPVAGGREGSIGLPLPGVRAEIRALDGSGRPLPPGERGELCVAGPNVMPGYWNRPEETAGVLGADGFLRTGDVGIMDPDGYVTLVDRIKDLILCSGFNVYPRTVEEALYRHPDVVAVTVVGMPDRYRGESPAAFVELRPGSAATPATLREFLTDKLSAIEMPRLIELRAELPRTAVGKLSKKELRSELQSRGEQA